MPYRATLPVRSKRGAVHCRRAARGNLQSVEPAPGNSHHSNRAVAPALSRQPSNHLQAIVLFLLGVLVEQQAGQFTAAAKVDADAGVAVTGQIRISQRIASGAKSPTTTAPPAVNSTNGTHH